MIFNELQQFRQTLYASLGNARDALFDLMDAVLVSACIVSFVTLVWTNWHHNNAQQDAIKNLLNRS
ncbi:hypothetical protein HPC62_00275 [Thermoleptolyngbya sichuanensis A183]|uniref:Uncharacterized protein n=1 Tax=Thermoleptolyngbya sichuanensis A183 TaxID=2737172 RepID=A0A6M8BBZ7_9CYAN|nr:hypothetical protein [Thermoleptolyngbya sichuanensis]QKD80813.1 hypothetical protein HPC62_00275 [Thermoleptolyngbya sichuanensis A183]